MELSHLNRDEAAAKGGHPAYFCSLGAGVWIGFAEVDFVAEGVEEVELVGSPEGLGDAGAPVGIVFCAELGVEFADAFEVDLKAGAGAAVAVVLGEMDDEAVAGDLHVERGGGVEAVFPVEVEAGVVEIELACFFDGEDAEDGDDFLGAKAHGI